MPCMPVTVAQDRDGCVNERAHANDGVYIRATSTHFFSAHSRPKSLTGLPIHKAHASARQKHPYGVQHPGLNGVPFMNSGKAGTTWSSCRSVIACGTTG